MMYQFWIRNHERLRFVMLTTLLGVLIGAWLSEAVGLSLVCVGLFVGWLANHLDNEDALLRAQQLLRVYNGYSQLSPWEKNHYGWQLVEQQRAKPLHEQAPRKAVPLLCLLPVALFYVGATATIIANSVAFGVGAATLAVGASVLAAGSWAGRQPMRPTCHNTNDLISLIAERDAEEKGSAFPAAEMYPPVMFS